MEDIAYSKEVLAIFSNPKNVGEIKNPSGVGTVGNPRCGDIMRLYILVDEKTNIIKEAKFKTFGCVAAIVTASKVTELIKGKTIKEALNITNKTVIESLNFGLPKIKEHCSLLAEEAVISAIEDYKKKQKEKKNTKNKC